MHFLLLVLRLVLDRLIPAQRDSLSLAARADGRLEHVPTRFGPWESWLRLLEQNPLRIARGALEVRAARAGRFAHGAGPTAHGAGPTARETGPTNRTEPRQ